MKSNQASKYSDSGFAKALQRVGVGLRKNLLWFLDFRNQPIAHLTPMVMDSVWRELNALAVVATVGEQRKASLTTDQRRIHWEDTASLLNRLDPGPLKDEIVRDIQALQKKIDVHLTTFIRHGFTLMHVPDLVFFVGKGRPGPELRNEFVPEVAGPVLYRVAVVLTRLGDHLGECKACGNVFLGVRLKQKYCSARCRARIAMREMRSKKKPKGKAHHLNKSTATSSRKEFEHGKKRGN